MLKNPVRFGSATVVTAALALAFVVAGGVPPLLHTTQANVATTTYGYITVGDSFSAGEGTYNPYEKTPVNTDNPGVNMCHRSLNSYAAQFQVMSSTSYDLTNVACSSGGTWDILHYGPVANNGKGLPDQDPRGLAQVNYLNGNTRLVTLSVGINDLGLVGFAEKCYLTQAASAPDQLAAEDACFTGIPQDSQYKTNLAALPGELSTAYRAVHAADPNAMVVVLTYPQTYPWTYTGSCESLPNADVLVTSQAMLNTAHGIIDNLDKVIKQQAAKFPNFVVVDTEYAFTGPNTPSSRQHDMCAANPWVNHADFGGVLPVNPNDESLHPKVAGYQALARMLADRLDAGHLSDATASTDTSLPTDSAIANAYTRNGGVATLGYPADNGGGPYVHYWDAPQANVEDFTGGSFGPAVMVDGPKGTYFVNYGFRTAYINGGYASTCRAPIDLAHNYNGGTRQDFVNCYMTWTSAGGIVVHGPNPTCPRSPPRPGPWPTRWTGSSATPRATSSTGPTTR